MVSRLIVIVLALAMAVLQASRGAWVETVGLVALASGLALQRYWGQNPRLRWIPWLAYSITAMAMMAVFLRGRH